MSILLALALAEAATGSVTVNIGNVRNSRGNVMIDICPQNKFLDDTCAYHGEAPAHAGTTVVTVANVLAGEYAIQAFHDENANGEVDRAMLGIPREGVGFSRDARIGLGPPKWRDAYFIHQGRAEILRFDLRYFMGAKGPAPARK